MTRLTLLVSLLVTAACVGGPGPLPGEDAGGSDDGSGSGSGNGSGNGSSGSTCAPGSTEQCRCSGGGDGVRQCESDGRSFGDCVCAADAGTGSDDDG